MPYYGNTDYKFRARLRAERRAKLIAKGIDPRSTKFLKLMYRR